MPFITAALGAIGAAIGAVGTFIGGIAATGIGKALLGIGLNVAMSFAQKAFAPKPEAPPSGVELELQLGENVPRKVMCGRFGSAGHLAYANAHGPANKYLQQVFVLSDFFITAVDKVWLDGELGVFGAEDPVKGKVLSSGDYAGKIWMKVYDGRQNAADSGLVSGANPAARWSASHIGYGTAYVIMTLEYDREKLAQPPQFFFEGRGAPLYDMRKDSTVGGLGAHRWDDPATWEYSANPALIDYCYRRGFSVNGDIFCGMNMPASDLPIDKYVTAANICDEVVGSRLRYVCSIGLDCDTEHGDNIEAIMLSCGGIVVNMVDGAYPLIGTAQTPVATITDADLIVGAPVEFQRRRAMDELVNSVQGTYPNPENQWSAAGYQRATDSALVAIDRRTRDVQIDFTTVPDGEQASQLASIYLSENRFEATAQITVRARWQVLEAGDWITLQLARYGTYVMMVADLELISLDDDEMPRAVVLSLQQRDGAIYENIGVTLPPVPLPPGTVVHQQEMQDFTVTPILGSGADGIVFPAIRVSWSAATDPTVAQVLLQWRVKADPDVIFDRTVPAGQTVAVLSEGVVRQTLYEVRHKIIADPPRPTTPSAWEEVTTLDTPTSDVTVGLGQVRDDIRGRLEELQRGLDTALDRLAEVASAQGVGALANYETIRETVKTVGDARAMIRQEEQVRADEDGALASEITTLAATVGDNSAAILAEQTTRADEDSALAQSLTAVSADLNDRFASGLMEFRAAASQTGVDARFSIMLRAGTADAFKESGLFLELYTVGGVQKSRMAVQADQFVVTDGATATFPLVFEDGELRLALANIGTVTAGYMQSPNEKTVFDLTAGYLAFSD